MKRPIKFRGRHIATGGKMVYGNLLLLNSAAYIYRAKSGVFEVDPNSIAQLVGYDKDGREVYEGDIIVDDIAEYVAHLFANVRISDCKLKEALNENQQNSLAKLPGFD